MNRPDSSSVLWQSTCWYYTFSVQHYDSHWTLVRKEPGIFYILATTYGKIKQNATDGGKNPERQTPLLVMGQISICFILAGLPICKYLCILTCLGVKITFIHGTVTKRKNCLLKIQIIAVTSIDVVHFHQLPAVRTSSNILFPNKLVVFRSTTAPVTGHSALLLLQFMMQSHSILFFPVLNQAVGSLCHQHSRG